MQLNSVGDRGHKKMIIETLMIIMRVEAEELQEVKIEVALKTEEDIEEVMIG